MNYLTVLGYPEHADFKKFWPPNVQVIGKDILRFHAAIWPGMLLGLGLPLPGNLYVHGFITVDGKKMSKSLGNAIPPHEIISISLPRRMPSARTPLRAHVRRNQISGDGDSR